MTYIEELTKDMKHRNIHLPVFNGNEWNRDYRLYSTKGYNDRYGKYVGGLAIMMSYLRLQNPVAWKPIDADIKAHNKRGCYYTHEELEELKWHVLSFLRPDTQRLFTLQGYLTC